MRLKADKFELEIGLPRLRPGKGEMLINALCYTIVPACAAWAGSVAQWIQAGTTPDLLEWSVIIVTTVGVGFSGLKGFMSESYSKYKARNGVDKSEPVIKTGS